jgi:hypothetical protein
MKGEKMTRIMASQKILEKAIAQAEANGWSFENWFKKHFPSTVISYQVISRKLMFEILLGIPEHQYHKLILTDHDFARALWGEDMRCLSCPDLQRCDEDDAQNCVYWDIPNWQYHLQQMVISEDWLAYVEGTL